MRHIAIFGLAVAALVSPFSGTAAAAETVPAAGDVAVYVPGPGNDTRHYLEIHIYPQQGIALASTTQGEELTYGTFRGNSYAIMIPKGQFEGPVDLKFPGVGEVVGTVIPKEALAPELPAKVCGDRSPGVGATFEGRIHFRGVGGYAPWASHEAEASITPECIPPPQSKTEGEALFGALTRFGPTLVGPVGFAFFAHSLSRTRYLEFVAFGDVRLGRPSGMFVAVDKEWLPGGVATERVVSLSTKRFSPAVRIGPGGGDPRRVSFAPPAPFFGHGTYRRRTGKLRGTLGVRFLGLKLRLAPRPLTAKLYDEEPEPTGALPDRRP